MARFAHAMPFGAELRSSQGVRFRLWAPGQSRIDLALGAKTLPMQPTAAGWFERTVPKIGAGELYRFILPDGQHVPDPASRRQPQDVHGPSEIVDPLAYEWRNGHWRGRQWEETVFYETHVGCFSPGGDFDGMRRKLDYLVSLGVTALELMPVADFEGTRNWGYDGVFPFAPDAAYGKPDDLKRLIDEAHGRALMVFLDVVYNHFGPSGNYLSLYAPSFFTDRHKTPWGAGLNFDGPGNAVVRDFFVQNALYWIDEYRFDGLRLDAIHAIKDDSANRFLEELAASVRSRIDPARHVHLIVENDDNKAALLARDGNSAPLFYNAQWNDDFHHAAYVAATQEKHGYYQDYADSPVELLAKSLSQGFIYQGEASLYRDGALRGEPSAHLPPSAFVNFLQNHDQIGNRALGERFFLLADEQAVDSLMAVLLLSPHIPLLFMGEEWGSVRPFLFFCDFHGDLADGVREGRRAEFSHSYDFLPGADRSQIPDPNAETTFQASKLDWDESERVTHRRKLDRCRALLALRRWEIVPRLAGIHGNAGAYEIAGSAFRVTWRMAGGAQLQLIANLSGQPVTGLKWPVAGQCLYTVPDGLDAETVIESLPAWGILWHLSTAAA